MCHKKTFVRFIDQEGNYLPDKYGRCDREDNCTYFLSPYHDGYNKENPDPNWVFEKREIVEKPTSYIDASIVIPSLQGYQNNALVKFLSQKFDAAEIENRFRLYNVGILNDWCIYWQVDSKGFCRSGKFLRYKQDGHRDKDSATTWEHSRRIFGKPSYPDFNLKQCFFGEHLLTVEPTMPVAIVESEKTAIIASCFIDKYIWISCGQKGGLADYKCKVLENRSVTLFPDLGAYKEWKIKAAEFGFNISDHIEKLATAEDRKNGLDLADYLLR